MSDIRSAQAREAHRLAGEADRLAEQHRNQRNRLIRQLRTENPRLWTYSALAGAVGCSPELIAAIVTERPRTHPRQSR